MQFTTSNGGVEHFASTLQIENNNVRVIRAENYKETINARMLNHRTLHSNLPERFDTVQRTKLKHRVLDVLKKIEPKLVDLALSANNVIMADVGFQQLIPLNLMGDGFKKTAAVVTTLSSTEESVFFIDEIENGLHFQTLAVVWQGIIEAIKAFDLQVFITTHSYEALKILTHVFRENEYQPEVLRLFSLQKNQNDEHRCYSYSLSELLDNLDNDVEVRGRFIE